MTRTLKGDEAVIEREFRLGRLLKYDNFSDYPVREEIELLEHILDIIHADHMDPRERAFEAGRLHYQDFAGTTFGSMVMKTVPHTSVGFKTLLLRANYIARHVFKNTNFFAEDSGTEEVMVTMENNDYAIDHFKGFFYEWARDWGLLFPHVDARETAGKRFEYRIRWGGNQRNCFTRHTR